MAGSSQDRFLFDDELIEILQQEMWLDTCGAAQECLDKRCACYLLGRNGHPIDVYGDEEDGWSFFRFVAGQNVWSKRYSTLAGAVRACQTALEQEAPRPDEEQASA